MHTFTKRLIAFAGAAVLTLSAIPTVRAAYQEDVPYEGVASWALREVSAMERLGLIPDEFAYADMGDALTREEMCILAVKTYEAVAGKEAPIPEEDPFSDTWSTDVAKAYALGIVLGDGNGLFRPDDSLTRLEFFCFISRFLKAVGRTVSQSEYSSLSQFTDAASLPSWGREAAQITVGLGIVNGTGSTLEANRKTSYMEALAMFYRARNAAVNHDPAKGFVDLTGDAKEKVLRMDQLGLVPATVKNRSMNANINRVELSQMLMSGYYLLTGTTAADLGTPDPVLKDTKNVDALNAYHLGLVATRGENTFDPGGAVPRRELYAAMANFLEVVGYDHDDILRDLSVYSDYQSVPESANHATQVMLAIGAISPTSKIEQAKEVSGQEALLVFRKVVNFYADWMTDGTEPAPYLGQEVAAFAKKYVGYDYTYGGKKPSTGFDCSGFVYYVYKQFGYTLNPGARNQYSTLTKSVKKADLIPGDIIFFSKSSKASDIFHVGIYIGDGKVIHASSGSDEVKISKLSTDWYTQYYFAAKRAIG